MGHTVFNVVGVLIYAAFGVERIVWQYSNVDRPVGIIAKYNNGASGCCSQCV